MGDNGAGKSVIKCLSGVHAPDEVIIIEGKPVKFTSPRQAAAGIGQSIKI